MPLLNNLYRLYGFSTSLAHLAQGLLVAVYTEHVPAIMSGRIAQRLGMTWQQNDFWLKCNYFSETTQDVAGLLLMLRCRTTTAIRIRSLRTYRQRKWKFLEVAKDTAFTVFSMYYRFSLLPSIGIWRKQSMFMVVQNTNQQ